MNTRITLFVLLSALPLFFLFAQTPPTNDECENAIILPEISSYCSDTSAFSYFGATVGNPPVSVCFVMPEKDVWFSVKTKSTDLVILAFTANNSLFQPAISLYKGNCGPEMEEIPCLFNYPTRAVYRDLTIGETYLIRVQGEAETASEGKFQLCLFHHNILPESSSDCAEAIPLCDKTTISVLPVQGNGILPDEAEGTCLSIVPPSETNSTWFSWTCETPGSLTLTLTPTEEMNDIDFVLYELPNGVGNCLDKINMRCMASGDFTFPSPCMGPTGLADFADDISEPAGCNQAVPQNNFVSPIEMIAGKSYALLVNNFSSGYGGYYLEFGGSGTFRGPEIDFRYHITDSLCIENTVIFEENTSYPGGIILNTTWNFGLGAVPQSATGSGPHQVAYSFSGIKLVSMTQHTESGCEVTIFKQIGCDTVFTGTSELTPFNHTLQIFPNPNPGNFSIYPVDGNTTKVWIYNLLGHCVFEEQLPILDGVVQLELARMLPAGVYLLVAEDNIYGMLSGKLVVGR